MVEMLCGVILLIIGFEAGRRHSCRGKPVQDKPDERALKEAKAYDRLQRYTGGPLDDDEE